VFNINIDSLGCFILGPLTYNFLTKVIANYAVVLVAIATDLQSIGS